MKANRLLALLVVLLAFAGVAHAQGVAWDTLTEQQRQLLAPYAERWKDLDPARQEQIARGAERYLNMSGGDRSAARDRFDVWRNMKIGRAHV